MQRKWFTLAGVVIAIAAVASLSQAKHSAEGALEKVMEKINKQNNIIKKNTRTAAAFKKTTKDVLKASEELSKLAKEAKSLTDAVGNADKEKYKNPKEEWDKVADEFISSSEKLTEEVKKGDLAATKSAFATVGKSCSSCHGVFRKEEE